MFKLRFVFLGLILQLIVTRSVNAGATIHVQEGQGFVLELLTASAAVNCGVQFDGELFDLSEDIEYTSKRGETIRPLARESCGVRVWNVNHESDGVWKLIAIDETLGRETDTFRIVVVDQVPTNRTVQLRGSPGNHVDIQCGRGYSPSDCVFKSHQTGYEFNVCELSSLYPLPGQQKVFSCRFRTPGSMEEMYRRYELVSLAEDLDLPKISKVLEFENSNVLQCFSPHIFDSCIAKHYRSGQTFYLENGLSHYRYSSYKTSGAEGICQFELPLPKLANETGAWKLQTSFEGSIGSGCIFDDGSNADEYIDFRKSISRPSKIRTKRTEYSVLRVEAPYRLKHCYLKTPYNEVIVKSQFEMDSAGSVGVCEFKIDIRMGGRFTCGFNDKEDSNLDLMAYFDVQIIDKDILEVENPEIQITPNESINLLCSSVLKSPVVACLFISPSDQTFFIPNNNYNHETFSYYGGGLERGECGISLKSLHSNDYGIWTCVVNLHDSRNVLTLNDTIMVREVTETTSREELDIELLDLSNNVIDV